MHKKILLLLDYGGVLGFDHLVEPEKRLAQIMGVSVDEMNRILSEKSEHGRAFRENRMTEYDFWNTVGGNALKSYRPNQLTEMWMNTYSLNEEFYDFCVSLRASLWVGILTNIDVARNNLLRKILRAEEAFDFYFPSYEFGFSKDTPELWYLVDKAIRKSLPDVKIVYVDDREEHVASAQKVNWEGVLYTDLPNFEKTINSLLQSEGVFYEPIGIC